MLDRSCTSTNASRRLALTIFGSALCLVGLHSTVLGQQRSDIEACKYLQSLDNPAEVDSWPRALPNVETLALFESAGLVADQPVYDQVSEDVATLVELHPDYPFSVEQGFAPDQLLVLLSSDEASDQVEAGSHEGFGCFQDHLDITMSSLGFGNWWRVDLRGPVDIPLAEETFERLADVVRAQANGISYIFGGPNPACFYVNSEDERVYLFGKGGVPGTFRQSLRATFQDQSAPTIVRLDNGGNPWRRELELCMAGRIAELVFADGFEFGTTAAWSDPVE